MKLTGAQLYLQFIAELDSSKPVSTVAFNQKADDFLKQQGASAFQIDAFWDAKEEQMLSDTAGTLPQHSSL